MSYASNISGALRQPTASYSPGPQRLPGQRTPQMGSVTGGVPSGGGGAGAPAPGFAPQPARPQWQPPAPMGRMVGLGSGVPQNPQRPAGAIGWSTVPQPAAPSHTLLDVRRYFPGALRGGGTMYAGGTPNFDERTGQPVGGGREQWSEGGGAGYQVAPAPAVGLAPPQHVGYVPPAQAPMVGGGGGLGPVNPLAQALLGGGDGGAAQRAALAQWRAMRGY
ncbi:MAG: hypothetical protein WC700_14530 [Gemmatimonadaceae bacterium]